MSTGWRPAWQLLSALGAVGLIGCSATIETGADHAKVCAARGLAAGSDDFVHCIEQEQLREQEDYRRIRQSRELLRDSGPS